MDIKSEMPTAQTFPHKNILTLTQLSSFGPGYSILKKMFQRNTSAGTYILQTLDTGKASGYQSVETRLNCKIYQNRVLKYKYRLSIWTMTAQAITAF